MKSLEYKMKNLQETKPHEENKEALKRGRPSKIKKNLPAPPRQAFAEAPEFS